MDAAPPALDVLDDDECLALLGSAEVGRVGVVVDGQPFWKTEAVGAIVAEQKARLVELMTTRVDPRGDLWMAVLESTGQPVRFT